MTTTETEARFTPTAAIRQAVQGHEGDVLDALNIPWRTSGKIRCPYPAHGGENDWRWDQKRAKAHCTCSNSDSIFNVVSMVEGIGFEAAKVRVAEILNRDDLIKTTGAKGSGSGRKQYQKTDAASLLNAPADNRDDSLPIAYLAHRLRVDLAAVPVPATRIAGLKALGYYDPPPQGSKAKFKLIGEFPCAVFGTVDAGGGKHAQRIYVASGGHGKADLGDAPSGHPRDPKKSAKVAEGDNTAGRSVLWGDPSTAPHIVITEGIETAAAVALSLKAEIHAGEIVVAAAISAGGVEAFRPYPVTTTVTVAADRDEAAKDNGRPGSRRGEQAARTFGIRNRELERVAIALPGEPGESVDWLDALLRDGAEAVRDGILAAVAFVPTDAEIADAAEQQERADQLQEIAQTYPLPQMDTIHLRYQHTSSGKIKVHQPVKVDGEVEWVPIATPFGVPARLRYADQADAYGLRCVVRDMNGTARTVDFDRAALAKLGVAEIRSQLFAAGLRVEGDGEAIAVKLLKAADPDQELIVVKRPGWHELPGCADPIAITPGGDIIGAPAGFALELAASATMAPNVARGGTLEGWRNAAAAALSVTDCQHWALGIIAPFAGPIVALTGLDTCGINLSGMSSSGKSTAQKLAASSWSTPDIRKPGLCQSARTTDNAVELLAQRASGTVLSLDELAHVNGKAAGRIIYTLAGGTGKSRMTADAGVRGSYTWATFAILSGECSLEEKVRGDGGEWTAGMAARIVDVDVTGTNRNVDAATLRSINDIDHHYGHAGPAFVRALIAHGLHRQAPALRDRILREARALAGGDTADSATVRAALPLALLFVAGELAKGLDIIPASSPVGEAIRWAWGRFKQSSDAAALDPETQTIANIRVWIAERWDVTVKSVDAESVDSMAAALAGTSVRMNNRETIAWYDDAAIYIPKDRIREAAGMTLKESQIGAVLDRRGMLAAKSRGDRFTVKWVPKIGEIIAYALSRKEFGRSGATIDPDTFKVYQGGASA